MSPTPAEISLFQLGGCNAETLAVRAFAARAGMTIEAARRLLAATVRS